MFQCLKSIKFISHLDESPMGLGESTVTCLLCNGSALLLHTSTAFQCPNGRRRKHCSFTLESKCFCLEVARVTFTHVAIRKAGKLVFSKLKWPITYGRFPVVRKRKIRNMTSVCFIYSDTRVLDVEESLLKVLREKHFNQREQQR